MTSIAPFKFIYILFFMFLLIRITDFFMERRYIKKCEVKKYSKV